MVTIESAVIAIFVAAFISAYTASMLDNYGEEQNEDERWSKCKDLENRKEVLIFAEDKESNNLTV